MKGARLNKLVIVGFQVYDSIEKAKKKNQKPTDIKQISGCQGLRLGRKTDYTKITGEIWGWRY